MTRLLKLWLVTMCTAACVLAASASASASVGPALLFPNSSESGPTVLVSTAGRISEESELQATSAKIRGRQLELEITFLEEGAALAGIYLAKFYETEKAGTRCSTAGAKEGEIEVGAHPRSERTKVVAIKPGSTYEIGVVFEISNLTIACGGLEVLVNGSVLGTLNPANRAIKAGSNTIEVGVQCSSRVGVPAITRYVNNAGGEAVASLEVESGGVVSKGCELIGKENTKVDVLPNKEIELMCVE